jgi:hypothetical protein
MTALPIVNRELRVVARRPSTYWLRVGIALLACCVGAYFVVVLSQFNMGALAKQMLYSMCSSVVGIYAMFAGLRSSADHISVEKREGTLGLLFLTDLKGYDVVLGKLCSTAIHSLYGMLAAFPVLGIALIGGGITGTEFFRGALALLNVVFFAHSVGLAVSTFSLNGRRALGTVIFIGFLFMWGIPTATTMLLISGWTKTSSILALLSPLNSLHLAVTSMPMSATSVLVGGTLTRFGANTFWLSFLVSHLLGWICLAAACWHLPRSWQNIGLSTNWRMRLQNLSHGSPTIRANFRRKLVAVNPFFWLASRARFDPHVTMALLIGAAAFLVWFSFKVRTPFAVFSIMLIVIFHLILRISIAASASRHFAEQRRSGALEFLLACTPMDTKDIVRGQWLALRRQFTLPFVLILCIDVVFLVIASTWKLDVFGGRDNLHDYQLFVSAMVIILISDVIALAWTGMWTGISANKPNRAAGSAIARVMAWPTIAAFVIFAVLKNYVPVFRDAEGHTMLSLWFFIGIGASIFCAIHSRSAVYKNFRTLAATPYEEQSGIMAAIGRTLGALFASRTKLKAAKPPPIPVR